MEKYMFLQLTLQLFIPAIFLIDLFRRRSQNRLEWLLTVWVAGLAFLFIFGTARWDWFSYYLRFLIPLSFIVASYVAYRRIKRAESSVSEARNRRIYVINSLLILVLLWLNFQAYRGYSYQDEAIDLAYPLKNGVYYVGGGGSSRWINNHTATPPQDYALDIIRLNVLGNSGNITGSDNLQSYMAFGDTIYSPCRGNVVRAVDGLPDQIPPNRDSQNPAGNHVVIFYQGVEILLAHMMEGSIKVREGDMVNKGETVGRIGNSGQTSQPHLHIHAERGGTPGEIFKGSGVPITFNGRFLVRNSLFREK
jgi:biotin carboxyl carrier protein